MPETMTNVALVESRFDTRWDYCVTSIHERHNEGLQDRLCELGREGWELVSVSIPFLNEYQCIFKRLLRS